MNEEELLRLLTGEQDAPIFVCRVSSKVAHALNATTTAVWLSRDSVKKQESHRRDVDQALYRHTPEIIGHGWVRIEPPYTAIFILHERREKIRSFKVVVKATKDGSELYLISIHKMPRRYVRSVYRRTMSLAEWERKRREVGPPMNPT